MNLTDHAGVRLTHGRPKVNIALENPAAPAQAYLDFFAGG
jgi:hypothetical protein